MSQPRYSESAMDNATAQVRAIHRDAFCARVGKTKPVYLIFTYVFRGFAGLRSSYSENRKER